MAILPIRRYTDIGDCRYADIADIFQIQIHRKGVDLDSDSNPDSRVKALTLDSAIYTNTDIRLPCHLSVNIGLPKIADYKNKTCLEFLIADRHQVAL